MSIQGKKVVIVEDEPGLAQALQEMFVAKGCTVLHVSRGDDALEFIVDSAADVVILDMMLPGTTGEFVLQELRQEERTQHIPVLFLTNFVDAANLASEAEHDPLLAYLVKAQVSLAEIVDQVEELLAGAPTA